MQKSNFAQIVEDLRRKDGRYDVKAYTFVREGLDYTLKALKRTNPGNAQRHVSGKELLDGLRQYTLNEFGPMGKLVLNDWGIMDCNDFGQIVFNLVNSGVLGKSDNDRVEDFTEGFSFEDAFVKPFLPLTKEEKAQTPLRTPKRTSRKRPATKPQAASESNPSE
jgi:uncharacterized repeat protein (TIGR04138 family)